MDGYVPEIQLKELEGKLSKQAETMGQVLGRMDTIHKQYTKGIIGEEKYKQINESLKAQGDKVDSEVRAKAYLDAVNAEIESLRKKESPKDNAKADELESLKARMQALEADKMDLTSKLHEKDKEKDQAVSQFKLTREVNDIFASAPYSESWNQFTKKGFRDEIQSKVDWKYVDGCENPVPFEKGTDQRVKNKEGTKWLSGDEFIDQELEKAGGKKKNDLKPKTIYNGTLAESEKINERTSKMAKRVHTAKYK